MGASCPLLGPRARKPFPNIYTPAVRSAVRATAGEGEAEGRQDFSDGQRSVQLLRPARASTLRAPRHEEQFPAHQIRRLQRHRLRGISSLVEAL